MMMQAPLRKLALTAHVVASVGWLGAVTSFLALAIAGLASQDGQLVHAAYVAMNFLGWFVIVPLSFASPLTGIVQSLGTSWGLFRYYWVFIKFVMTIPATALLLVHMRPVGHLAQVVTETTLSHGILAGMRIQLTADAGAALVVLVITTALSIYKPGGLTAYGRTRFRLPPAVDSAGDSLWGRYVLLGIVALVILAIVVHLAGGGLHAH
jgi:hypothetical protein